MTALIMCMCNIYPHIGHMAFQIILIRELQIELLVIHYFIFLNRKLGATLILACQCEPPLSSSSLCHKKVERFKQVLTIGYQLMKMRKKKPLPHSRNLLIPGL